MKFAQINLRKIFNKKYYSTLILFICFSLFSVFTLFFHYKFSTSFSFVDEYTHFVASDFMVKGNVLYQDIFFHHQPLPVYLSFLIEKIYHSDTLYKLVTTHRLAIFIFSFFLELLLIYRFRFIGFGFVIVYETTKYYLFGNLFLGEALVALPMVYLFGLLWEKLDGKKLSVMDFSLAAIFCWFILFSRETLAPAAFVLYILLHVGRGQVKQRLLSIIIFAIASVAMISTVPLSSYVTNLISANFSGYIQHELTTNNLMGISLVKVFFYPVLLLFTGVWNEFRLILIFLDILFFIFVGLYLFQKPKFFWKVIIVLAILGLCSIRWSDPGSTFYAGFHQLPWYALFIMTIFLLWNEIEVKQKLLKFKKVLYLSLLVIPAIIIVMYPNSYMTKNIDRERAFTENYGRFYTVGSTIKLLSQPNSTLFVDQWDSLVYWQAGLRSSYHYVFFYPVMGNLPVFTETREQMFAKTPPDFYYIECPNKVYSAVFASETVMDEYIQLRRGDKTACLYVHKKLYSTIPAEKWNAITAFGFNK